MKKSRQEKKGKDFNHLFSDVNFQLSFSIIVDAINNEKLHGHNQKNIKQKTDEKMRFIERVRVIEAHIIKYIETTLDEVLLKLNA